MCKKYLALFSFLVFFSVNFAWSQAGDFDEGFNSALEEELAEELEAGDAYASEVSSDDGLEPITDEESGIADIEESDEFFEDQNSGTLDDLFEDEQTAKLPKKGPFLDPNDEAFEAFENNSDSTLIPNVLRQNNPGADFGGFDPADLPKLFSRVPLKPRMSDANWRIYAGPALTKVYYVRKGDSLWEISDRLFGTPYLWPKVWQLNAYITNPNIIEIDYDLHFFPGNLNSAPVLALRGRPGDKHKGPLPPLQYTRYLTLLQKIENDYLNRLKYNKAPFREFYFKTEPELLEKIPKVRKYQHITYPRFHRFKVEDLKDGQYSVVRKNKFKEYFQLKWIGLVEVKNKRAEVVDYFEEIMPGDYLADDIFRLNRLDINISKKLIDEGQILLPINQATGLGAGNKIAAFEFGDDDDDLQPGSYIQFGDELYIHGRALVLTRDENIGTIWITNSRRELYSKDLSF